MKTYKPEKKYEPTKKEFEAMQIMNSCCFDPTEYYQKEDKK